MALERTGIGAILEMDVTKGVAQMGRAKTAFQGLNTTATATSGVMDKTSASMARTNAQAKTLGQSVSKIQQGAGQVGGAMRSATMVMGGMVAVLGMGTGQAAKFEQQMSVVQSILRPTATDMTKLTDEAERLGITSVFSATQSAQAMEFLGRAGFKTSEIMVGLGGVMDAAAAEGMDLATAADIVASQVRAFGLQATDATRVADVMALASSKANTNMVGLAEGLKFTAPIAKRLGMSIEDTVAALGLLADSGVKGTTGGTALKNALLRLAAPTGKAAKRLEQLGLTVADSGGNFVGLQSIMKQLGTGMNKMGGNVNQTAAAAELFGLRGVAVTNLLDRLNVETSKGAKTLGQFTTMLDNASGSAKEMADIRLDNLTGALKLLTSSIEAFSIQTFGMLLKPFAGLVKEGTEAFNKVIFAVKAVRKMYGDLSASAEDADKITKKYGSTATQIAVGIVSGFRQVTDWIAQARVEIGRAADWLRSKLGPGAISQIAEMAVKFGAVAVALTPLLAGLTAVGFVIGAIIVPAVSGIAAVASGAFGALAAVAAPLVLIVAGLGLAFMVFRQQGEGVGATFVRLWETVKSMALDVWHNVLQPIWMGMKTAAMPIIRELEATWRSTLAAIKVGLMDVGIAFDSVAGDADTNWTEVGATIATVVGGVIQVVSKLVNWMVRLAAWAAPITKIGFAIQKFILGSLWSVIKVGARAWDAVSMIFSGNVLSGLARLGIAIVDMLIAPLRLLIRGVVKVADLFSIDLPQGVRTFAESGFGGLVFPAAAEAQGGAAVARQVAKTGAERARKPDMNEMVDKMSDKLSLAISKVNVKNTIAIDNRLSVDGREAALAVSSHTKEINERAGFKATPWQRNLLEAGATPL